MNVRISCTPKLVRKFHIFLSASVWERNWEKKRYCSIDLFFAANDDLSSLGKSVLQELVSLTVEDIPQKVILKEKSNTYKGPFIGLFRLIVQASA